MANHNILGEKGEQIAERYLLKHSYKILAKNWRHKHLEVDIIALKDNTLVIIEVKTRSYHFIENLYEIVTKKKQRFLLQAAEGYIDKFELEYETRFDIILIVIKDGKYNLKHVPEAFSGIG